MVRKRPVAERPVPERPQCLALPKIGNLNPGFKWPRCRATRPGSSPSGHSSDSFSSWMDGRMFACSRPETLLQALMMIWTCCDDPRQSYCCPSVDATASDSDAATQVDLSHEALILGWPSCAIGSMRGVQPS
jgi:hypothetical protein